MKTSVFAKLTLARPRTAGIAVAALAACGAAITATPAQAGYSFEIINDSKDKPFPPPPATGGVTFTNLMGITTNGDTVPGFFGSGQGPCSGCSTGDPNTGFVLTLPSKTFTPVNPTFVPPFNAKQTQMTAVNGNGTTFTGYTYPSNLGVAFDPQFGFYEKGGVFTMVNNIQTPDCSQMNACDQGVITENQLIGVNNADLAVGFYNDRHGDSHGYTYQIGAANPFSPNIDDPNAKSTVTAAINNSDEIAGFFTDKTTGAIEGFIKEGNVFTTVNAPGAAETELLGINDSGLAVGFYCVSAGCPAGSQHGLLFNSMTDMFTTIDPPESMNTTLNGLNDKGQIVGFFVDKTGNTDGLLANPIPEPSTWIMILAGFAGLSCLGLRRSRRPEIARVAL